MKNFSALILLILLLPLISIGQRKKIRGKQINISSSITYAGKPSEFSWSFSDEFDANAIDLTFLTPTSGLFDLEKDTFAVDSRWSHEFPENNYKLGFSIQVVKTNHVYHEIEIPYIIHSSSEFNSNFFRINLTTVDTFSVQRRTKDEFLSAAFKYEIGKYLRDIHKKKLNLGFGFNILAEYSTFSKNISEVYRDRENFSPTTSGKVLDLGLGLTSDLWIRLSNKVSLELDFSPYLRLYSVGAIRYLTPSLPYELTFGKRNYQIPSFNFFLSLSLKFNLEDFNYGRRRKG